MRIFLGFWFLLTGAPLFVYSIVRTDAPAALFVFAAGLTAAGIACLYPRRWMD